MSNIKILKRRIKSAKNIAQITKAMEMVAASKMKRSQNQALQSRPYSNRLRGTIGSLMSSLKNFQHPLLSPNESGKIGILLISTNKSLCGGLNTNLFREIINWSNRYDRKNLEFITVGKKGAEFVTKLGFEIKKDYSDLGERFTFIDTLPISRALIDSYGQKEIGQVAVFYSDFISTLVQKPQTHQLLPIDPQFLQEELSQLEEQNKPSMNTQGFLPKEYLIEPDPKEILTWLLPYFIELQIYHYLLEAAASEHSARMVSMKNATDNAKEIVTDLALSYNKARQAQITSEISEVAVASLIVNHE